MQNETIKVGMNYFLFFTIIGLLLYTSCKTFGAKEVAKTVVDVATATCVIDHAWSKEDEIMQFCSLTQDALPMIKKLLSTHRQAARRASSKICQDSAQVD